MPHLGIHHVDLPGRLGVCANDATVPRQLAHACVVQLAHDLAGPKVAVPLCCVNAHKGTRLAVSTTLLEKKTKHDLLPHTHIEHPLQLSRAVVWRRGCAGTVADTSSTRGLCALRLQPEPVAVGAWGVNGGGKGIGCAPFRVTPNAGIIQGAEYHSRPNPAPVYSASSVNLS